MLLKAIWLTSLGLSISAVLGLLILAVHRHGAARLNRTRTALIETIAHEVNQCDGATGLPVDLLLTHIGLLPSVVLSELELSRAASPKEILSLGAVAVAENFGYRQINSLWRCIGTWQYFRKHQGWGVNKRRGFKKPPPTP